METRLKLRFSRLLRSSFRSCKSGNPMDAVQEPVFLANHGNDFVPLLHCNEKEVMGLPLGVAIGWGCMPRWPPGSTPTAASTSASDQLDMSEGDESLVEFLHLVETRKAMLEARGKSSEGCEDEDDGSDGGKSNHRISPSAVSAVGEHAKYCGTGDQKCARRVDERDGKEKLSDGEERKMDKKKKKKKKKMKIKQQRKESCRVRRKAGRSIDRNLQSTSSSDSGWFSSQEDKQKRIVDGRKKQALFSKTGSSESSDLRAVDGSSCVGSTSNRHQTRLRNKRERKPSRILQLTRTASSSSSSSCSSSASCCCCPSGPKAAYSVNQKMKDSVAVVKRSSDPYSDFRESMVEMIIEKQIFDHGDLKQLLHCFLSLNSQHHHPVIIDVFWQIWHALFSA